MVVAMRDTAMFRPSLSMACRQDRVSGQNRSEMVLCPIIANSRTAYHVHGTHQTCSRHTMAQASSSPAHLRKEVAVLRLVDGLQLGANQLHAVLLQDAALQGGDWVRAGVGRSGKNGGSGA